MSHPDSPEPDDDKPPTKRQILKLKKLMADLDDPTRYVIVSPMLRGWCFFYNPEDAHYLPNRIEPNCLFKRKAEAQAVAKVLNGSKRKKDVQVITVRKTKKGFRILDSVADPANPTQSWKPKLERNRAQKPHA